MGADLADAVQGPVVEAPGAVRLALQADADVLDGARQRRVGHAGEGARGKVLRVAEAGRAVAAAGVAGFEPAARGVECAELDGHAGADADEGRQRALVEGEGALVLVDGGGGFEGACVLGRCLETDFDDVKGLAWQLLVTGGCCDAKPKALLRAVANCAEAELRSCSERRSGIAYRSRLAQCLQQRRRRGPSPSGALRPVAVPVLLPPCFPTSVCPAADNGYVESGGGIKRFAMSNSSERYVQESKAEHKDTNWRRKYREGKYNSKRQCQQREEIGKKRKEPESCRDRRRWPDVVIKWGY